jgi:MoaA/NifB/PqqE/SkfB family radical SAM enzyme
MTRPVDVATESERETRLLQRVRSGRMDEAELDAALPAFPLKLQIQTASPCHAACAMCPWPETRDELPQGRMSEELFDLIVEQIAGRGVERIGLFLMNEPLLDARLERLTARLVAREPRASTVIYTNGEHLLPARAQALAEAGLSEIDVSVVGFEPDPYARFMQGVNREKALRNLEGVAALLHAGRLGRMLVRVVGLDMPEAVKGLEAFRERFGLEVQLKDVTNRAGLVDVSEFGVEDPQGAPFRACQRPFVKAYVLYNGDVVLCNCDWRRATVFGNVARRPLAELWHDAWLMEVRRQHLRAQLAPDSLCARCDYVRLG